MHVLSFYRLSCLSNFRATNTPYTRALCSWLWFKVVFLERIHSDWCAAVLGNCFHMSNRFILRGVQLFSLSRNTRAFQPHPCLIRWRDELAHNEIFIGVDGRVAGYWRVNARETPQFPLVLGHGTITRKNRSHGIPNMAIETSRRQSAKFYSELFQRNSRLNSTSVLAEHR